MKTNLLFFSVFFHLIVSGQEIQMDVQSNLDATSRVLSAYMKPRIESFSEKNIKGNKYYKEEYKIAEIYVNNKKIHEYAVRYDAYSDEIEVAANNKTFALSKGKNIRVLLKDSEYKLLDTEDKKGYFIILNKNKEISLVLKARKKIKKAVQAKSGYGAEVPPSFIKEYTYFIQEKEGGLKEIKLKKKDIIAVLKDKKDQIEEFASSKKINFKKEEDVITVIDYYNTL